MKQVFFFLICMPTLNAFAQSKQAAGSTSVHFNISKNNNRLVLSWETDRDNHTQYYEIERSSNGVQFEKLKMSPGPLDPQALNSFIVEDCAPLQGMNYYQIKITGKDGKVSYSELQSFENGKKDQITLYPNPAKDELFIQGMKTQSAYHIKDMTGATILKGELSTSHSVNVENLPKGVYLFTSENANSTFIKE